MNANEIKRVACIGSGVIGTSWALAFAWRGCTVKIYDIGDVQIEAAKKSMDTHCESLIKYNVLTHEEIESIKGKVSYTTNMAEALDGAQFVQESGPEKYEIKESILSQIESLVSDDVIIASSTSGLLITEMSKKMAHPERLIGGHPYNPPHLIPLVEIIKGKQTDPAIAQTAYDFYKLMNKEPVILNKEVTGFLGNRLQYGLYREAMDLVANGVASLEDVDKAVQYGPGLRWALFGPMMVYNLGSPIGLRAMHDHIGPSLEYTLSDMATWNKVPETYLEKIEDGLAQEMAHRPAEFGQTWEDICTFRDSALIEILKLHKKL